MSNPFLYKTPLGEKAVMAFYDAVLQRWPVPTKRYMLARDMGIPSSSRVVSNLRHRLYYCMVRHPIPRCGRERSSNTAETSESMRLILSVKLATAQRTALP